MLPFDKRPWARAAAVVIILCTVMALIYFAVWAHLHHRLNPSAIVFILLVGLTVIPPNYLVARRATRIAR
jgi:hypothetical protein